VRSMLEKRAEDALNQWGYHGSYGAIL